MAAPPDTSSIFSVSQLTGQIRTTLESRFSSLWIRGELSNLTKHSSGHWYFTLKDSHAQISSVMFRRQNHQVGFEPAHGMQILVHGNISVYPPQGRYQIIVDQMLPGGLGDLHLAYEALKQRLAEEGLFDTAKKKPLPSYPKKIGIVTSPTGAAIRDMIQVMQRRFPLTDLLLVPVKVQGDGAAAEIASGIKLLNDHGNCDVIITGRGGGSLEDLWAFNEESVARAIFDSTLPVISAVGHEIDVTISDLVADKRAPTPSVAGELVVPDQHDISSRLGTLEQRANYALHMQLKRYDMRLNALISSYAIRRPQVMIQNYEQGIDNLGHQVRELGLKILKNAKQSLDLLEHRANAMDPLKILSRGYSVVTNEAGDVIHKADQVIPNEKLGIRFHRGRIFAIVEKENDKAKNKKII